MKVGEYIGKKGFNERDIERAVRENMIKIHYIHVYNQQLSFK